MQIVDFRYTPPPVTDNLLDELAKEQPLFKSSEPPVELPNNFKNLCFRYTPPPVTDNLLDELAREQPLFKSSEIPVELPGTLPSSGAGEEVEEPGTSAQEVTSPPTSKGNFEMQYLVR